MILCDVNGRKCVACAIGGVYRASLRGGGEDDAFERSRMISGLVIRGLMEYGRRIALLSRNFSSSKTSGNWPGPFSRNVRCQNSGAQSYRPPMKDSR